MIFGMWSKSLPVYLEKRSCLDRMVLMSGQIDYHSYRVERKRPNFYTRWEFTLRTESPEPRVICTIHKKIWAMSFTITLPYAPIFRPSEKIAHFVSSEQKKTPTLDCPNR